MESRINILDVNGIMERIRSQISDLEVSRTRAERNVYTAQTLQEYELEQFINNFEDFLRSFYNLEPTNQKFRKFAENHPITGESMIMQLVEDDGEPQQGKELEKDIKPQDGLVVYI
jgi:hypothetical protein